jgi:hypothetical protein
VSKRNSPGQLSLDFEAADAKALQLAVVGRIDALPVALYKPDPFSGGSIKTKPTLYKGVFYDSRTESKYALAWDLLGIRHKTEAEKFKDYEGKGFVPDFYLPDYNLWVEVASDAEISQAIKAPRCQALADATGQAVLLTKGFPGHWSEWPLVEGGIYLPHPHKLNPTTVAEHFPDLLRLKAFDKEAVRLAFATARKASFESADVPAMAA